MTDTFDESGQPAKLETACAGTLAAEAHCIVAEPEHNSLPSYSDRQTHSFMDIVARHRTDRPGFRVLSFLGDAGSAEEHLSFAELDARARAIAATLQKHGLTGKPAMLLHPPGLDFVAALFGCLYSGTIAVPAYPPTTRDTSTSLERLEAIKNDSEAKFALTTSSRVNGVRSVAETSDCLRSLKILSTDKTLDTTSGDWTSQAVSGQATALLQYTSGSTGDPKGVELSHSNLLSNLESIAEAYQLNERSVGVIWLPPYHDMGLIGGILEPIWLGFRCVLMSPRSFARNPLRWLKAISHYRATISGGPNSAYELCTRRYESKPLRLDLASWEVAFNGSEPIRGDTLRRFAKTFESSGFRSSAFVTNYGLAEATLMVTSSKRSESPRLLEVGADALERGLVELSPSHRSKTLVSSGRATAGTTVVVVRPDQEEARTAEDNQVGEIWVSGASVASGYYNTENESRNTFDSGLPGRDERFLRTGDLGFVHAGELFVSGRMKDLIIVRGRNIHPHDLEKSAEQAHQHARPGCCVAFSVQHEEMGEGVVVLQEVVQKSAAEDVAAAIRHALFVEHQVSPLEIVIARRRSVLKTSSGKLRRRAMRRQWSEGRLEALFVDRRGSSHQSTVSAVTPTAPTQLFEQVRSEVAKALDHSILADEIDPGERLSQLGMDSLAVVNLKGALENLLEIELPIATLLDDPAVATLVERVEAIRCSPALGRGETTVGEDEALLSSASAVPSSTRPKPAGASPAPAATPAFSLMFFSSYGGHQNSGADKYKLVIDATRFADRAGFEAIWVPERHFHPFGGLFPNPAVVASALAAKTERIRIRSGSVVLPLHDPIRVAEDWSVVDNLSEGRVDLAFATGWDANAFVLAPHRYEGRYEQIQGMVDEFRSLWQGNSVSRCNGDGENINVQIFPTPRQSEPGLWLTAAQNARLFEVAGAHGYNVLTALLFQSPETLSKQIALYRNARAAAGLDPGGGRVTLMLHAFVGNSLTEVRRAVKEPFTEYLESSVGLWSNESEALSELNESGRRDLLQLAFERYYRSAALFGTVETAAERVAEFRDAGVDEIACLLDFGVSEKRVMEHLPFLDSLRQQFDGTADSTSKCASPIELTHPASAQRPQSVESGTQRSANTVENLDLAARHDLAALSTHDVFERAEQFDLPDQLRQAEMLPFYLEFTKMGAAEAEVRGEKVIMMGGLDYLGLSSDPRVREAAAEAALSAGTSRTGSRLHCGSTPEQRKFEALLASFLGREDAIVFASGYMAQSGLVTALMDPDSTLVLDDRAHASIVDGGLIAQCRIARFSHNDVDSLERVLQRVSSASLVMIESLYSNEGDLAPLPEIREVCDRNGARLAVDEAHGLGVLGSSGRGLEEHFGMPGAIDVVSGTFSKSLASVGGWISGTRKVMDWIRFHGRSILFSAAISPAALAAAQRSLEILIAEPDLVSRLRANSRLWSDLLTSAALPLVKNPVGPLAAVRIGNEKTGLLFSRQLLDAGVYANTVLHPSVPRGEALIRTVVSARHQDADLRTAAGIFGDVYQRLIRSEAATDPREVSP